MKLKPKAYKQVSPGVHVAVLAELVDLDEIGTCTPWGAKGHWALVFEVGEKTDDGGQMTITSFVKLSYHPKANLTAYAEALLGRELNKDEMRNGVDSEDLVGRCCQIVVKHVTSETTSRTSARITSAMPLAQGQRPMEVSDDYVTYAEVEERRAERRKEFGDPDRAETKAASSAFKQVLEESDRKTSKKPAKGKKAEKAGGMLIPTDLPADTGDSVPY